MHIKGKNTRKVWAVVALLVMVSMVASMSRLGF